MKIRVYEHKPGRWHLDLRAQGKGRPYAGASKAEAERNAPEVLARAFGGSAVPKSMTSTTVDVTKPFGITIEQAFKKGLKERDKWLKAKDKKGIYSKYAIVAERFGKDSDLTVMTRQAMLDWRTEMLESEGKRSGSTTARSTVNKYISMATTLQKIAGAPEHRVPLLSVKGNERKRRVRETEIKAVLAWLLQNHDRKGALSFHALIQAGLYTTARQGLLLNLRWTDVYFDRSVLCFRTVKNEEYYEAPLNTPARVILQNRLATHGKQDGPFSDLDTDTCTRLWTAARKAVGLADDPEFVFHVATRHEGLSRMGDAGDSAYFIQAMGGHKNIQSSARYVKPKVEALRAAAERIAFPQFEFDQPAPDTQQ